MLEPAVRPLSEFEPERDGHARVLQGAYGDSATREALGAWCERRAAEGEFTFLAPFAPVEGRGISTIADERLWPAALEAVRDELSRRHAVRLRIEEWAGSALGPLRPWYVVIDMSWVRDMHSDTCKAHVLGLIGEIVRQGAGVGIHILATRADGPAIYLYQANLLAAEVSAFDTGAITLDGL